MRGTGPILAIAGQVGWDAQGRLVSDDFVEQFAQALQNVVEVVEAAGGKAANLIRLQILVGSKDEYLASVKALGPEYKRLMGKHFPAMTLVEVKSLYEPGAQVEIEGLAVA